ncbi:MAG: acetate/propionate family kinase [Steroidobacterales bacterium]
MLLLVFNAGSSSLKFELLEVSGNSRARRISGGAFIDAADGSGQFVPRTTPAMPAALSGVATLAAAAGSVLAWLADASIHGSDRTREIAATVHRIVHGGERFRATTVLGDPELAALAGISELAPLHNPPALAVIGAVRKALGPAMPVIGVFDTAYYAELPEAAYQYALPPRWRTEFGIRRYGFHGTAHRSLCQGARELLGPATVPSRIVSLQLGRGCSVTATHGTQAMATSMGFTPLEGLVMGTRSGDVDPGALLHVMERTGMSPSDMSRELNNASGLLGLSGRTAEMSDLLSLERAGERSAALAVEVFCRRARHYLAAYIAELGGVDAIVFGGGIGENCPDVRRRIIGDLGWAGIEMSPEANDASIAVAANIATPSSRAAILVIPVDEASVIAGEAAALLRRQQPV